MKHPSTPNNSISTAILVDGGFFINRYRKVFRNGQNHTPNCIAENFYRMAMRHLDDDYLYRIIYYDCPPFSKRAHNPISLKSVDYSKTNQSKFRLDFFEELKKRRKIALRFGYLNENPNWTIKPAKMKELFQKKIEFKDLVESDVFYDLRQKGVDIKIGLDIASLSYKKMVDRIVLVSGDGDFVPAAKLARREGIDFILDPMWNQINPSLWEHIDGLKSTCENPRKKMKEYPYRVK